MGTRRSAPGGRGLVEEAEPDADHAVAVPYRRADGVEELPVAAPPVLDRVVALVFGGGELPWDLDDPDRGLGAVEQDEPLADRLERLFLGDVLDLVQPRRGGLRPLQDEPVQPVTRAARRAQRDGPQPTDPIPHGREPATDRRPEPRPFARPSQAVTPRAYGRRDGNRPHRPDARLCRRHAGGRLLEAGARLRGRATATAVHDPGGVARPLR